MMSRVFAVVVTYFHENKTFEPLLRSLLAQVTRVIVVDNTPGDENPLLDTLLAAQGTPERCQLVRLRENLGIARAINVGLDIALAAGADFILLSDQDSLPADDMVPRLIRAYTELSALGMRVGAVGPTFTDLHTALTYPFQAQLPGRFFYGHQAPTMDEPHVEALTLITSGALIPGDVIRVVGPMREDFFIDHVDIEWCHRARWKGYHLFGTGWATMYQRMGEAPLRVWYLRWRYESAYSPLRVYYRLRNFVALWKLNFIDFRWKVRNTWYWLGIVYAHTFYSKQQNSKYFLFAIKGVWHGLRNRMGPYKED
ncbi:MAG: glycosyltransferase family 2 protein [Dechloromonas sp.]|nr:glycosyltransferase family 2 protein [Candidatus Dechloromonas phosphoritropha]MBP8787185.1 glycosyltransferase family 2 protein [Azonexus sp.]